jgi:putative spermidine/putrescine transport system ATP-binding protein
MNTLQEAKGAVVEFSGVSKAFGNVTAVENFSLNVDAGEFLTLLGPSGSGKTTALNMVAGFLNPGAGEISIAGVPVTATPIEKRNIGMVFQSYSLFPHMNVGQNVAFPLKMRGADRRLSGERVETALNLVGLGGLTDRMPNQLSGGQRQRVAFARAIVFEPKVLLMDEPLGALDLKLRERMQLEIKHYQEQIGCTVIYVTHDQGEALTLSDRIVIMDQGRIVQIGDPEQIYDHPNSRFAAEFIGETNILALTNNPDTTAGGWLIDGLGAIYPQQSEAGLGNALLSVRPEKIVRHIEQPADGNGAVMFDATVTNVVFFGDVHRYTVRCSGQQDLVFKELRSGGTGVLRSGETVRLSFLADDAVLLPEKPTGKAQAL